MRAAPTPHPAHAQGFTLIETLIVLAIVSILLGIGIFSLMGFLNRQRANEAATDLAAGLRQAGGRALARSEGVTVDLIDSGHTLRLRNSAGAVQDTQVLPGSAVVTSTVPAGPVVFSGRGLPDQQYTLTLQAANLQRTVVLLVTGKVVVP